MRVRLGLFQEIERAGGAGTAIEQGLIQAKVAQTRAERQAALARRADTLTGTSDFADLDEVAVAVLGVAPSRAGPKSALSPIRLAEPYEALREASDRILAERSARGRKSSSPIWARSPISPRAPISLPEFLSPPAACGGDQRRLRAALTWVFRALDRPHRARASAFAGAGTKLVCFCGSDETYAREAVAAAKALTEAGATHIYYAGRPPQGAEPSPAGVGTFIHVGCDALAVLQATYELIK